MSSEIRVGTRRSKLALAQANWVAGELRARGVTVRIVEIVTSGDRGATPRDGSAGLKGLFVAEIVRALQAGEVDLAVHSAKDLPSEDPDGIAVAAVPVRAPAHDVLVSREPQVGPGAKVGSSSLRRRGQFRRLRPDCELVELRGNVDTRLAKVADGTVDAAILAAAGLARLGLEPEHLEPLSTIDMVPAPGQGALAIQTRAGEEGAVAALDDPPSRAAFLAERRVMDILGGGCALPLGAFARAHEGGLDLRAVVFEPDGSRLVEAEASAAAPDEAARRVADTLLANGAAEILEELL